MHFQWCFSHFGDLKSQKFPPAAGRPQNPTTRPKNHPTQKLSWKLPDKKKPYQNRNPSTKKSHQDWLKNNSFTHKKCIRPVSFREIFWGRGVSPFGLKHLRSACGWPWIPRPKIRRPAADPRPPDQKTTRPPTFQEKPPDHFLQFLKNHPTTFGPLKIWVF